MKKSIIAFSTLAALALVVVLVTQGFAGSTDAGPACQVDLDVTGMTCAMGCAPRVKAALEGVKGVKSANVEFETASAQVSASGGVCEDKAGKMLVQALKDAGFGGTVKALKQSPAKPGKS